jgi:polyferredoxin
MKKKWPYSQWIRHSIQIVAFFLLPGLFASAFAGLSLLISDLMAGVYTNLWIGLLPLALLLLASALFGRFFCGYLCAFGTLSEAMGLLGHRVFHLKTKMPRKVDAVLKYLKYAVLLALFISFFFTGDLLGSANIWSSFSDLFTLQADYGEAFSTLLPGSILLLALLVLEIFFERFFCRYLCPLGALLSLVSHFRLTKIKKERSGCGACRLCANQCPMGIPTYEYDEISSGECIDCLECVSVCPRANPAPSLFPKKSKDFAMALLAATTIGLYYAGNIASQQSLAGSLVANSTKAVYVDGTYTGTGTGFKGTITLSVTISGGVMVDITTVSTSDSAKQYNQAFSTIKSEALSAQNSDVAGVSGCTYSSNGIKEALADALQKALSSGTSTSAAIASSSSSPTTSATSSASSSASSAWKDGTYTGTGRGHGTTTLKVVVSGGKITSITTVSTTDTASYYSRAFSTVTSRIIAAQKTSVQAVSGATQSSNGIMAATASALNQAL